MNNFYLTLYPLYLIIVVWPQRYIIEAFSDPLVYKLFLLAKSLNFQLVCGKMGSSRYAFTDVLAQILTVQATEDF